jgi:hypothetical protein
MEQEWSVVRNCSWLHEAEFVRSLLESEGIDAQIPDEFTIGVDPGYINMLGGVRVTVPAGELDRANEILNASEPSASLEE